ncbi:MAG: EAL domain-containing protein [Proteobacteria bacterium]|nr:EAL domain-containing protein [Pseudomonadota bacterium]
MFSVALLAAAASLPGQAEEGRTLVDASTNNFPPVNMLDAEGRLVGFGPDLAKAVAAAIGRQIIHLHSPYGTEVLGWIQSGSADFIHNIARAPERDSLLDFTDPVLRMDEVVFVAANRDDIAGLDDLRGRGIACVAEHVGHLFLREQAGLNCFVVRRPVDAILALLAGDADAFVFPREIGFALARNLGLRDRIKVVGEPVRRLTWHMAVRKGNTELLALLNRGIVEVRESGEYDRIQERWFGEHVFEDLSRREVWLSLSSAVLLALILAAAILAWFALRARDRLAASVRELTAAERRLKESERYFRSLIENASDVIAVADAQGVIRYASPAVERMLGYTPAELEGRSAFDLIHAEDIEGVATILARLADAPGRTAKAEFGFRHAAGTWRRLEAVGQSIGNGSDGVRVVVNARDITERRQAQDLLRLQGAAMQAAVNAIIITDSEGRIEWVNRAFTRMSGYPVEEAMGQTPRMLNSGRQPRDFYEALWRTIRAGEVWRGELTNRRKNGTTYVVDTTITPLVDEAGRVTHFVAIQDDVTTRKAAEADIEFLAHHDMLTGLANRVRVFDDLQRAIARARRDKSALAVHYLDLDRFKDVNDAYGHEIGDFLIKDVAKRLKAHLRETDTVGRLGGDEFAVVQTGLADPRGASVLAGKVLDVLARPFVIGGHDIHVGASIGVTVFPMDGTDPNALMRNADLAMYRAKNEGRRTYRFFARTMEEEVKRRVRLAEELRAAVAAGEFELHYQPQVDLCDRSVVGAEALIRWRRPGIGLVGPADFIPVAEEVGLILPIGEWALRRACAQAKAWAEVGHRALKVAVNVSPVQFERSDLVELVGRALSETGADPAMIELEITETVLLHETEETVNTLAGLRRLGVSLTLDDFGTGYSSLTNLRRFPVSTIKIDRAFVSGLDPGSDNLAIVRAIISLAQTLKLRLVAEGVENMGEEGLLRAEGCPQAQGYLYGRPVPAEDFAAFLGAPPRR